LQIENAMGEGQLPVSGHGACYVALSAGISRAGHPGERMYSHRKQNVAAQRFAERRRREDDAPRLSAQVPDLVSLRLEVEERSGEAQVEPAHIRRVVVEHAPALFLIPCGDPRCNDGGHDITRSIMNSLTSHEKDFRAEDACGGYTGTSGCSRVLHVHATAEYRA
jgi:hypothetical protein